MSSCLSTVVLTFMGGADWWVATTLLSEVAVVQSSAAGHCAHLTSPSLASSLAAHCAMLSSAPLSATRLVIVRPSLWPLCTAAVPIMWGMPTQCAMEGGSSRDKLLSPEYSWALSGEPGINICPTTNHFTTKSPSTLTKHWTQFPSIVGLLLGFGRTFNQKSVCKS